MVPGSQPPAIAESWPLFMAAARLADWLATWRHPGGGYHGPVIHRFRNKRMWRTEDTAWTQAAMIQGYAHWWERTGDPRWHDRMVAASDAQCANLLPESGKFRRAGHEDERFCSLVHCALADVALLRAATLVEGDRSDRYLATARLNVDRYCLGALWVPEATAFKFSEVDHWSPLEHRFVVNFNTMGGEALLALHAATGEPRYRDVALQVGEWLIARCDHARQVHQALLAGRRTVADDPASEWMAPGGLAYQYTPSQPDPDNCVVIYGGLALRGLSALYRATEDPRYAQIIREAVVFTLAMRDRETGLFLHTTRGGRVVRWPQFVAGAGMILTGLATARAALGESWEWTEAEQTILGYQAGNGSFPGFVGKAGRADATVWEDRMATPNWNAQLFEYLARRTAPAPQPERPKTLSRWGRGFWYLDSSAMVAVISYWPPRFWVLYLAVKRHGRALVYLPAHVGYERTVELVRYYARGVGKRLRRLFGGLRG